MASVGIVGGLGPESTIDYYRRILAAWHREDPSSAPSLVIDSLDVARGLRNGRWTFSVDVGRDFWSVL